MKLILFTIYFLLLNQNANSMNNDDEKPKKKIMVHHPNNKYKHIFINEDLSWEKLKGKLKETFNDYDSYKTYCGGMSINWETNDEDHQKAIVKLIYNNRSVQLVMPLPGGGPEFYDYTHRKKGEKIHQWSKEAPPWRVHAYGANLLGICKNNNCKANGKQIVSGLGYGIFYIIENEIIKINSRCPLCHQSIIPKTSAFNNCYFRITWRKDYGDRGQSTWEKVDDECLVYDESDNTDTYNKLRIESRSLDNPPSQDNYDF